jgi:peptidyl-prolyl cis-trans isomerase B (cyclophilin B)
MGGIWPVKFNSRHLSVLVLAALLGAVALVAGCSSAEKSPTPTETTATAPVQSEEDTVGAGGEKLYIPEYVPNGKETATFKTSQGEIVVQLFGDEAPIHVGSFIELSQKGFYDETKFHRYEPNFVVQGGDPQTKDATSEEVKAAAKDPASKFGTGGPGYNIKGEFDALENPNKHVRGALGMARSQSPDSAGSQFYFTLAPAAFLDGQYTVFGQVTKGLDVMDKLRVGDTIESITISGTN